MCVFNCVFNKVKTMCMKDNSTLNTMFKKTNMFQTDFIYWIDNMSEMHKQEVSNV